MAQKELPSSVIFGHHFNGSLLAISPLVMSAIASVSADRRPSRWIIGPADDLTWFILSTLGGYVTLLLFKVGVPLFPILLVFLLVIDSPHVWSTLTRTYFDKSQRKKRRLQLFAIVPLLLVGPAMSMLGQARLFFILAYAWAYYHHAKQEYGFVMLYKSKNRDRAEVDMRLDRLFIMVSMILPYAWYIAENYSLTRRFPLLAPVVGLILSAYIVLVMVFVARQIQKYLRREVMNWPKLSLLVLAVPLQWTAFSYAIHHEFGILAAAIPINTFHALQYHRLMWFHNRNHYSDPVVKAQAGFAGVINSSVVFYIGIVFFINLAFFSIASNGFQLQGVWTTTFWGISFTHYFLDSKIWRVRGDKELAAALRL